MIELNGKGLSEKQVALAKYVLERLGFESSDFLLDYLNLLANPDYCKDLRYLLRENVKIEMEIRLGRNLSWEEYREETIRENFPNEPGISWNEYLIRRSADNPGFPYSLINPLMAEYTKKKNKLYKLQNHGANIRSYVTASDLMSLHFCPAAFSINITFQQTQSYKASIGTTLHEKTLLDYSPINGKSFDQTASQVSFFEKLSNKYNSKLFNDIKSSTLIYKGHVEHGARTTYITDKNSRFFGDPDYVFQRPDGTIFIVEEKFRQSDKPLYQKMRAGHKVQLASYLTFLDHPKCTDGYLIYWRYYISEDEPIIKSSFVLNLPKTTVLTDYVSDLVRNVHRVLEGQSLPFSIDALNANKCTSCSCNPLCVHKNSRLHEVQFPYTKHPSLYHAVYPEILKQDNP